jgi:betaine reductase
LALDSASQEAIKKAAEEHQAENLFVVWGITNEQYLEVGSRTVIDGDPSWSGPLAGESLRLKVFHILEPLIKNQIPRDIYEDELMLLELAVGEEKIEKTVAMMEKFRSLDEIR